MSDLVNYINNPRNCVEEERGLDAIQSIQCDSYVEDGVLYWTSNDRVPFDDMLEVAVYLEVDFDLKKSQEVRDNHNAAFMAEYFEAQANRSDEQKAEERFEMQAAFGKGETVVNVFTGEKTYL